MAKTIKSIKAELRDRGYEIAEEGDDIHVDGPGVRISITKAAADKEFWTGVIDGVKQLPEDEESDGDVAESAID